MKLDEMEFGRRLAVERELTERSQETAMRENAAWDETGNFVLYPSLVGIKGEALGFRLHQQKLLKWYTNKLTEPILYHSSR